MRRKDMPMRFMAGMLSVSMIAAMCAPSATVLAAEQEPTAVVETYAEEAVALDEAEEWLEEDGEAVAATEEAADAVFDEETQSEEEASELLIEAVEEVEEDAEAQEELGAEEGTYVLMNIPYADFYRAEVNNDVAVDAFTSATLNKTKTGSLVGGSYHVNSDGTDITGITYPVKVGAGVDLSAYREVTDDDSVTITVTNRGQTSETEYKGQEALFESASYSYYKLSETPDYYKELTVENGKLVFGKATSTKTKTVSGVEASFTSDSSYGDYQLNVNGLQLGDDETVYGVVIQTKEGSSYGLRHMENIWRQTSLAWSVGNTTAVHNCPTSSEHYKAMVGQTITGLVYYTSEGIYEISLASPVLVSDYRYVYAALSWSEYWQNEGVYNAGSTASSSEADAKGELDKGAFDTVSRATTNHGLHRGSFQCTTILTMKDGTKYNIAYYTGATTAVLTDGTTVTYNKEDVQSYVVTGLKYVPVRVATEDYEAFKAAYSVVENGTVLTGGFSENELQSYTNLTASLSGKTYGLKTAVKNADGTFSFSARKSSGTESGLQDDALKTASDITATVKEANGSYGEFLRVDLTGNYGDLASRLQAVKWSYYGTDTSSRNPLVSYGTKFAADNWMHKSMGIQLGLTESLRCQLPEGTDGTGKWTITLYALGYQDYTITINVTSDNIVSKEEETIDTTALAAAIQSASALKENDYTAKTWADLQTELAEAKEELAAPHTQATVNEATEHLKKAIEALEKAASEPAHTQHTWSGWTVVTEATAVAEGSRTRTCTVCGEKETATIAKLAATGALNATSLKLAVKQTTKALKISGLAKGDSVVKWTSSKPSVVKVTNASTGALKALKKGKATITVTLASGLTRSATVTVQTSKVTTTKITIAKKSVTLKKGETFALNTVIAPITSSDKVTYTSGNKKVATVSSKGVITAKKKGKTTITVKSGKKKVTCKVTVK